jgi:hypothetical protein
MQENFGSVRLFAGMNRLTIIECAGMLFHGTESFSALDSPDQTGDDFAEMASFMVSRNLEVQQGTPAVSCSGEKR